MLHRKQDRPADRAAAAAAELYDRDPVLWSEQQAALLAMMADGNRPAGLDWANIIEEIESLGRSQVNAVQSLLLQALVHEFKAASWPNTPHVEHWLNESRLFQAQARQQYLPSMRQRIDTSKLLKAVIGALPRTIDGAKALDGSIPTFDGLAKVQLDQWLADAEFTISLTKQAQTHGLTHDRP